MITPEDEKRYKLPPLPDVPFCGKAEAKRLNDDYVAHRRLYRILHPDKEAKG